MVIFDMLCEPERTGIDCFRSCADAEPVRRSFGALHGVFRTTGVHGVFGTAGVHRTAKAAGVHRSLGVLRMVDMFKVDVFGLMGAGRVLDELARVLRAARRPRVGGGLQSSETAVRGTFGTEGAQRTRGAAGVLIGC